MCTIHTYSKKSWDMNKPLILNQLDLDSISNSDGVSVVFLDGHNAKANTILRTMDVETAAATISMLMAEATKYARVFIHLRAATTTHIGVAYTHAFDDMQGVLYMHNGVITNSANLAVDSYNMVNWNSTRGQGMLTNLLGRKEYWANVFRIDTVNYRWSMTRMSGGTLYTDGHGNYSTRIYGPFNQAVLNCTTQSYTMPKLERPVTRTNYYGGGTTTGWNSGRVGEKWDRETRAWVPDRDWERDRRGRVDSAWAHLYEEDEVGGGATLPPFRSTEEDVENVSRIIERFASGDLEAAREMAADQDNPEAADEAIDTALEFQQEDWEGSALLDLDSDSGDGEEQAPPTSESPVNTTVLGPEAVLPLPRKTGEALVPLETEEERRAMHRWLWHNRRRNRGA